MAKISEQQRQKNEDAIRASMDRLLRGELPPVGRCDLKTLAAEAGVARSGFYPKKDRDGTLRPGPYQHLAQEFERRLRHLQETGQSPDPRDVQITRLKAELERLKERLRERDTDVEKLTAFKQLALSRLTTQHDEITRLRQRTEASGELRLVPHSRTTTIGTCS